MTGTRLFFGAIVMGIAVPVTLFLLLQLHSLTQLLTIATVTFLSWGVTDVLASIVAKPRLKDRTPGTAIREEWERRTEE